MYADVLARDTKHHRFTGLARSYFGVRGYLLSLFAVVFKSLIGLTIYLILSASFIRLLFPQLSEWHMIVLFWAVGSLSIFFSIKRETSAEIIATATIGVVVIGLAAWGLLQGGGIPLITNAKWYEHIFIPLGALIFSFGGGAAIPSLISYYRKRNVELSAIKKPIIIGTAIPLVLYFAFVVGVLMIHSRPTVDTITGLVPLLPEWAKIGIGILGLASLWSSYMMTGFDVRDSLHYDMRYRRIIANTIVVVTPIMLYVLGLTNFIQAISITGGVFGGMVGILLIRMWKKSKKEALQTNSGANVITTIPSWIHTAMYVAYILSIGYGIYLIF
jgi:amino acid permease